MASEAGVKDVGERAEQCFVVALSIVQRASRGVRSRLQHDDDVGWKSLGVRLVHEFCRRFDGLKTCRLSGGAQFHVDDEELLWSGMGKPSASGGWAGLAAPRTFSGCAANSVRRSASMERAR